MDIFTANIQCRQYKHWMLQEINVIYTEAKIKYLEVKDHCHFNGKCRGAVQLKKFSFIFHNGSNYDDHFITKGLVKGFKGELHCLRENTKKYEKYQFQ